MHTYRVSSSMELPNLFGQPKIKESIIQYPKSNLISPENKFFGNEENHVKKTEYLVSVCQQLWGTGNLEQWTQVAQHLCPNKLLLDICQQHTHHMIIMKLIIPGDRKKNHAFNSKGTPFNVYFNSKWIAKNHRLCLFHPLAKQYSK